MGIYMPAELELMLFQTIEANNYRLLYVNIYPKLLAYFQNNENEVYEFLNNLQREEYIQLDGVGARAAILFGHRADEWREKIANEIPGQPQMSINQTFNHSQIGNMNTAGHDINFNQNDAERLIEVLKQVIPTNPEPTSLAKKVRSWLDCSASALEILKRIGSLM